MDSFDPVKAGAIVIALMIAIIGHEIMHGLVAYKYGDNTAKNEGRLSINPIVHIDVVGTIIVPLLLFVSGAPFLFGWAKPVPVNTSTVIRNGGYGAAVQVSLAGILYNLSLALLASVALHFVPLSGEFGFFIAAVLYYLVVYNLVLAVFNLWPIPPLDGSNAVVFTAMRFKAYAVVRFFESIERYGMVLLILILATPLAKYFLLPAYFMMDLLLR